MTEMTAKKINLPQQSAQWEVQSEGVQLSTGEAEGGVERIKTPIEIQMEKIIQSWQCPLKKVWSPNMEPRQIAMGLLQKYFPEAQFNLSSLKSANFS